MDMDRSKPFPPQRIARFRDALFVHLVDFPIYYMECISERHFVVAGGGGSAKTGVHNQINILELVPTPEACTANLVTKYNTPKEIPDAIMNGSLMRHLPINDTRLITGGASGAVIYTVNFDTKQASFRFSEHEFLNDERVDEDIKTVKCMPGKVLTGGMNGQLAVWGDEKSKSVEIVIKAHSKPIDDIDIDVQNQQIVTLSRDESRCVVWSLPDLKMVSEFKKEFICTQESKYLYRSARYASVPQDTRLIIACNPISSKDFCKLYKLSAKDFKMFETAAVRIDGIMAMTVSLDGEFVGLGSRDGSVRVLRTKNLSEIYNINQAHHNAVTSLQFLDPKPESLHLTNSNCCALLSASIDRRVILHRIKKGSLSWTLCKIFLFALLLYVFFSLLFKNNNK